MMIPRTSFLDGKPYCAWKITDPLTLFGLSGTDHGRAIVGRSSLPCSPQQSATAGCASPRDAWRRAPARQDYAPATRSRHRARRAGFCGRTLTAGSRIGLRQKEDMSRLLVFQHVAAEPLGTLDALIRARGHRVRFHNFHRQPDAEPRIERYRGLIVLGGPMNVEDQHRLPHLRTELRTIEQALKEEKPVLGICLGAQLLAHVLGAPVRRHVQHEIGWYDLQTTTAGRSDPVLGVLGERAPVFQWHSRTFDLPHGAEQLARTETCEQQAFRFGAKAYGFQFHLEADRPLIERWLSLPQYRAELLEAGPPDAVERIREATAEYVTGMEALARRVFENFLDLVGRPTRRLVLPSRH
jgi:GMP synthase (glutamine-hydrolysing)